MNKAQEPKTTFKEWASIGASGLVIVGSILAGLIWIINISIKPMDVKLDHINSRLENIHLALTNHITKNEKAIMDTNKTVRETNNQIIELYKLLIKNNIITKNKHKKKGK